MKSQIICIEGLFGSGKSTTMDILNEKFSQSGRDVQAFHEFDKSHPILIEPEQIETEILSPDILKMIESKWNRVHFAPDKLFIMESRIWQYAAMYPILANCSEANIQSLLSTIYQLLNHHSVKVIYFSHGSPREFIEQLCLEPERQEWLQWVSQMAERLPWLQRRGFKGSSGWKTFMLNWTDRLDGFYATCPFDKIQVKDAWKDRVNSLNAIETYVQEWMD